MSKRSWAETKQFVYERAIAVCEYCQTSEANIGQTLQIDHILPNGGDDIDNLCAACWSCNSYKHKATSAIDSLTVERVPLFNPRTQKWTDHFEWDANATRIYGKTAIGRATVARLRMNRAVVVIARARWVQGGYHPP
jgi:HNH endonuclease